ncbi:gamma-glutamyltransferase family protein [Roseicitreum antarcticum]|uniref:Gamma-glutamyltranspeptidase / glutathione hydrolase n=1 Tax=Roseicitreum antarcticum TaxID=564137 RepID=A0A1H2YXP0_9RHOB|nr:gamma-glutamyltransferase family protein [Roseicitreum antarcticum]SDX09329.1 gamma-glutamyltranspeptidase / glutathione hydrolase [Roseicitreum antarcticum]
MTDRGMVVAPQPEAAESGVNILRAGGNAVDAAIATALVQTVVDPLMCGIAGFGSMAVYDPATGRQEYLDFHAPAPAAVTEDMWADLVEGEALDGFGFLLRGRVNDLGAGAVAVPASLRAYEVAHQKFGKLPWADVVAPAIRWADEGYFVRPAMYAFFLEGDGYGRAPTRDRLTYSEGGRRLLCDAHGAPKAIGAAIVNPDYADVLRLIARDGADALHDGPIGDLVVDAMEQGGGLVTRADLAAVRPTFRPPLEGTYRGLRIATNQPPGGGVMLLEMLNILENFDLAALGHNSTEYIRILCEVMKRATGDKDRYVGDPGFCEVPLDMLLDKGRAAGMADDIRRGVVAHVPRLNTHAPVPRDTTHLTVRDGEGCCVALTHSLAMPSGVVPRGTGFMLNGCMSVFDPRPGKPGSLAPGKSRFTASAPTIVHDANGPRLILGAPGGTQIVMGILQTILNHFDFGMDIDRAVAAARVSATSDFIDVCNRIPRDVLAPLVARGYAVHRNPHGYTFGWVHAIAVRDGQVTGAADPGRDGVAYRA